MGIKVIRRFQEQSEDVADVATVPEKNDDIQGVCVKLLYDVGSHALWSRRHTVAGDHRGAP